MLFPAEAQPMLRPEIVRVIRDPIHGYIALYAEDAIIIDSPLFQRLRRIRQNGTMAMTYPSAVGTRFEHSLGAMHLAGQFLEAAFSANDRSADKSEREVFENFLVEISSRWQCDKSSARFLAFRVVRLAALLHDIGHLPFSHCLEPVFMEHIERLLPSVRPGFANYQLDRADEAVQLHEYRGY
jgi:uncharacterized protein